MQPHLNVIRLGQGLCHGGVILDGLTGATLELIGGAAIQSQLSRLDAAECKKAARALEDLESRRETAAQILETESCWTATTYGLVGRIGDIMLRKALVQKHQNFVKRYLSVCKRTNRLTVRLAARACELETGKQVTNTADLVPSYLKAIPKDPETGESMTEVPANGETMASDSN